MKLRSVLSSGMLSLVLLCASMPARAGIPTIDIANLLSSIQQVVAWVQQAEDMLNQINQMRQQYQQLRDMTSRLEGVRNLGTILNDPTINSMLPSEMRDASQILLNPRALVTNPAALNQILTSFGVDTSGVLDTAQAMADNLGRAQQILASAQRRGEQLSRLASRVDATADAKESIDMVNRNILEAASINNQMMQTMAAMEAARSSTELKRLAENQAYFSRVKAGGAQALRTFSY